MAELTTSYSVSLDINKWQEMEPIQDAEQIRAILDDPDIGIISITNDGENENRQTIIEIGENTTLLKITEPSLLTTNVLFENGSIVFSFDNGAILKIGGLLEQTSKESLFIELPDGSIVIANQFIDVLGRAFTEVEPSAGEDQDGGAGFTPYSQTAALSALASQGSLAGTNRLTSNDFFARDNTLSDDPFETDAADLSESPFSSNTSTPFINFAPVARNDSITVNEDSEIRFNPLENDSDPNSGQKIHLISVDNTGLIGDVSVLEDGSIIYDPAGLFEDLAVDEHAIETLTYVISDDEGKRDEGTIEITVRGQNDAPSVTTDYGVTAEDTPLTFHKSVLSKDDRDIDGDTLSVIAVDNAKNGVVSLGSDGTVTFSPDENYHGPASFEYTISDGNGGVDTGTVHITVTPVNDAPDAVVDYATMDEDTVLSFPKSVLRWDDKDVDGDSLKVTRVRDSGNGEVWIDSDGNVNFQPDQNFNGKTWFFYTVNDGNGGKDTGVVRVTVNPVNDAPIAVNDYAVTDEDNAVSFHKSVLRWDDIDVDGDSLKVTSVQNAQNGSVTMLPDGTITFMPDANFNGETWFEYTVIDGNGGSDHGVVTVTVNPVNDAPDANPDFLVSYKNIPIDLNKALLVNDTDIDGDSLYIGAIGDFDNGQIIVDQNGNPLLIPDENYTGEIWLPYAVSDGNGGFDVSYAAIEINPITLDDLVVETTSVTMEVLDANAVLNEDGSMFISLSAEISALSSINLSFSDQPGLNVDLLNQPFLTAELSGDLEATAIVRVSDTGIPSVEGGVDGNLDFDVQPGQFFQPLDAGSESTPTDESLDELFLAALSSSNGLDIGALPPLSFNFEDIDGTLALLQTEALAQAAVDPNGNLFLEVGGALEGFIGVPLEGPTEPVLITELFGEFYGAALVQTVGNFDVAGAGNIDGDFDARIVEQNPAPAPELLANLVPDDLATAA